MNIYDHGRISVRKFGGTEADYYAIHKFMDSSKLFYYHVKHRMLLHNLYGIELAVELWGDYIQNAEGRPVLVRDIAAEHCKEDLSGRVPSLNDCFQDNEELLAAKINIPEITDPKLANFLMRPRLRSNLQGPLIITLSNFGVHLVELCLGFDAALELSQLLSPAQTIDQYLADFQFTQKWQYTPDRKELMWLKSQNHG